MKKLAVVYEKLMAPSGNAVSLPVEFYYLALLSLNNGLALNFYWEVIGYIRLPYLVNKDENEIITLHRHRQVPGRRSHMAA
ncbi:MAG: hypothetical protein ACLRMZ_20270 [Blautia marasmi]